VKYNPDKHHRRSIRLKGYDYSQNGAYFVTICTWQRQSLFGDIVSSEMQLSRYGEIVQLYWDNLIKHHCHLELDCFVIMPNHVHGIIILTDNQVTTKNDLSRRLNPVRPHRHGLPEIIRGFKTFSARSINKYRRLTGVSVWQRGYYEHIIRSEESLHRIREYIINNPENWEKGDELHPDRICKWYGKIIKLGLQMDLKVGRV
jgi:putative transposase